MTKYEVQVKWDIAESGIFPMSTRELLDLLPEHERQTELDQLLDVRLGYSEACGSEELRHLIAATYEHTSPSGILVTTGAIEANFLLFNVLLEPGDHVGAVDPAYQQVQSVPRAIGCDVSLWRLRSEDGFRYDLGDLERLVTPKTRLIVVNTPHNPTGATLSDSQLDEVIRIADRVGAWVLSDEAYRWLEIPGAAPLPAPLHDRYERAISVGTVSKPFGIPGVRIGWFAATAEIAQKAWGIRDYVSLSPAKLSDRIAQTVIAEREPILARNAKIIGENLATATEWFAENSDLVSWTAPRGGLLAMLRYILDIHSAELADRLAAEKRVMLAPGSAFGIERHLRIGIGQRPDIFREGLARTADLMRELARTHAVAAGQVS